MKPFMHLQGKAIGFLTDMDKEKRTDGSYGYKMETVRNCIIEATLKGVRPSGNQFNIIAGRCYITKEGCTYLLNKIPGLSYKDFTFYTPKITGGVAEFPVLVVWRMNGKDYKKEIKVTVKYFEKGGGVEAAMGKAERKAKAWLIKELTNNELPEGEVDTLDVEHEEIKQTEDKQQEEETTTLTDAEQQLQERANKLFDACKTVEELQKTLSEKIIPKFPRLNKSFYNEKLNQLQNGSNNNNN